MNIHIRRKKFRFHAQKAEKGWKMNFLTEDAKLLEISTQNRQKNCSWMNSKWLYRKLKHYLIWALLDRRFHHTQVPIFHRKNEKPILMVFLWFLFLFRLSLKWKNLAEDKLTYPGKILRAQKTSQKLPFFKGLLKSHFYYYFEIVSSREAGRFQKKSNSVQRGLKFFQWTGQIFGWAG